MPVAVLATILVLFVVVQFLWVRFNGSPVPRPTIPRGAYTIGSGKPITYVVMGDSTTISQGGSYDKGYASEIANYLAGNHTVTWANVGASGARAKDVATTQLKEALVFKPDLVVIAVGANDVTHLTSLGSVRSSLFETITSLRKVNKDVQIVLTGSPDMGSVPRFPQPTRWYAGVRTNDINSVIMQLAGEQKVAFAPIAAKTGPVFRKHPELFAADKFHPTTEGYALWVPVLKDAIDDLHL